MSYLCMELKYQFTFKYAHNLHNSDNQVKLYEVDDNNYEFQDKFF